MREREREGREGTNFEARETSRGGTCNTDGGGDRCEGKERRKNVKKRTFCDVGKGERCDFYSLVVVSALSLLIGNGHEVSDLHERLHSGKKGKLTPSTSASTISLTSSSNATCRFHPCECEKTE